MDKSLKCIGYVFATVVIALCGLSIQIVFKFPPFISGYFTGVFALFFNYQLMKNYE